jgi:hypothetical protein
MCICILLLLLSPFHPSDTTFGQPDTTGIIPADSLETLIHSFLDNEGYHRVDTQILSDTLLTNLDQPEETVFRADSNISPPGKALLIFEYMEPEASHYRFKINYVEKKVEAPPAAAPVIVSFIKIDRLNLGEAFRSHLKEIYGEENIAPVEYFNPGPHLSWRFVTRPVMGQSAHIVGASRKVISDRSVSAIDCMRQSCLETGSIIEKMLPWSHETEIEIGFDPAYKKTSNGLLSPSASTELLFLKTGAANISGPHFYWRGIIQSDFSCPSSEQQPQSIAILEHGLGQDITSDAALFVSCPDSGTIKQQNRIASYSSAAEENRIIIIHQNH